MKNLFKLFGIIAIAAVIIFSMAACSTEDKKDPTGPGDLPSFPEDSDPAVTADDAYYILEEMSQGFYGSPISRLYGIAGNYIDAYVEEELDGDWDRNFSFSNKNIPNEDIKLTASKTSSFSATGGLKTLFDLMEGDMEGDDDELMSINLGSGDTLKMSDNLKIKGELTSDKDIYSVTIVKGSIFEQNGNESSDASVAKAGNLAIAELNISTSAKMQTLFTGTVTTASGSIKIVLDVTESYSGSAKNVNIMDLFWDDDDELFDIIPKYSGSLKIYGKDNKELIKIDTNNEDDYYEALALIGFRYANYSYPVEKSFGAKARVFGSKQ